MDDPVNNAEQDREPITAAPPRPVFAHPQWSVGVVLVFAVVALVAGLSNPIWWIIGSPCILALGIYVFATLARHLAPDRGEADDGDA